MTGDTEKYSSPLGERYASRDMLELWSARRRFGQWRRLWVALAEEERDLGVPIPAEAIAQMNEHVDNINFETAATFERRFRHDVMAHVHTFAEVAPAARPWIHLGATSAYVTDNADLILMRHGLQLLRAKAVSILASLSKFATAWRATPTLGYTHLQPAQLTTVGKRATLWMQDLVIDIEEIDHRLRTMPFRGIKGATGTQGSFLELFNGDHGKVRELDQRISRRMGFVGSIPVSGQTYTRKIDAQILAAVTGLATSAAKFSSDIRVLQAFGEIEEPFEREQIGSSAMAYKRNPMRSERIAGLARFVIGLENNANYTHSFQFFERTLDDSANRRLSIPESFLATDAVLLLMGNIAGGLEVHTPVIERRVAEQLPFMSTEAIIMHVVRNGKDRQDVHEIIRKHSMVATESAKLTGAANDLFARLAADSDLGMSLDDLRKLADPARFIGRAPQQVDEFLRDIVLPIIGASGRIDTVQEEIMV